MTTTNPSTQANSRQRGFSLVEMLVTIAVIGVIVGLMVPVIAHAGGSESAKVERNAQTIVSMATNAIASGNLTIPEADSAEEVVDMLSAGVFGSGVFEGTYFKVSNLQQADKDAVLSRLEWDGGILQIRG